MLRVPDSPVGLSTASVYPQGTASAFEMAASLGYDGVELMVWTDPVSQDIDEVERLSERYSMPVLSVHAPCLLITQRVWSPDPWVRLTRSIEAAQRLGASTVVVHPPFRWQREYAKGFGRRIAALEEETGIVIAVENMYPWRAAGREVAAYAPHWDPALGPYSHITLDLSHAAVAGADSLAMAEAIGDRLSHVHMTDGTPSSRDEHLIPGRGNQPCAALLERLARQEWSGAVILEVTTRRARSVAEREADLDEALAFTRLNLATSVETAFAVGADGTTEKVVRPGAR
ncbi:sugar phosphate isomerase/epimerase [Phytoactinopolyspora alkaliphila]|uniref:Sugar phosphate isomerase/epimerase n=1 Tax=Phytoactinopolyspora alkaliphila TaxID=1783498 RepID=A0A6N9YHU3_9ACTN|nr:sugar phosphate isomerase/epimerase [Phytoactinopolyspora alkaliphila]NED94576.1 sugar phosphate isomerase/epimerase [Phytoactinopolyspora alkaliphila]